MTNTAAKDITTQINEHICKGLEKNEITSFADIIAYKKEYFEKLETARNKITEKLLEQKAAKTRNAHMEIIAAITTNYPYLSWMNVLVIDSIQYSYSGTSLEPCKTGCIEYYVPVPTNDKLRFAISLTPASHKNNIRFTLGVKANNGDYLLKDDSIYLPLGNLQSKSEVLLAFANQIEYGENQINTNNHEMRRLVSSEAKPQIQFEYYYPRSSEGV